VAVIVLRWGTLSLGAQKPQREQEQLLPALNESMTRLPEFTCNSADGIAESNSYCAAKQT